MTDRFITSILNIEQGAPIGDEQVRQIGESADLLYKAIGESVSSTVRTQIASSGLDEAGRESILNYTLAPLSTVRVKPTAQSLFSPEDTQKLIEQALEAQTEKTTSTNRIGVLQQLSDPTRQAKSNARGSRILQLAGNAQEEDPRLTSFRRMGGR